MKNFISLGILTIFVLAMNFYYGNETDSKKRSIASVKNSSKLYNKLKSFSANFVDDKSITSFILKENLQKIEYTGNLNAVITDSFDRFKNTSTQYYLESDNGEEIFFKNVSSINHNNVGKRVHLTAFEENSKLVGVITPDQAKGGIPGLDPIKERPDTLKYEKMLVLFVKFRDSIRTYIDMPSAKNLLNSSYKKFFDDASERQVVHKQPDVFGWYYMNREGGNSYMPCGLSNQEIRDMITHYNIDITQYTNISLITNCMEYNTIGGRANLGPSDFLQLGHKLTYVKMAGKPSWLAVGSHAHVQDWTSFIPILVHERGHNFGLYHSNALDCGNKTYLQDCVEIPYGNHFDRMGAPKGSNMFNADQQRLAGWKDEAKDFHHIKQAGVYTLDRLTTDQISNKKIGAYVYIPGTEQKAFMVEYRQGYGMDGNLNAWPYRNVYKGIHLYSKMGASGEETSPSFSTRFNYIDSNPTDYPWSQDTAHESLTGDYFDPATGLTIGLHRQFGQKANIHVYHEPNRQVCFKKSMKDWIKRPHVRRYLPIGQVPATPAKLRTARTPSSVRRRRARKVLNRRRVKRHQVRSKRRTALKSTNKSSSKVSLNNLRNHKDLRSGHVVLIPGDDFKVRYDIKLADHLMCPRNRLKFRWHNFALITSWVKEQTGGGGHGDPTGGGGTRPGGVGGPGGGGTSSPNPWIDSYFSNYEKTKEFKEMTVPVDALGKDYKLTYTAYDRDTAITKNYNLYIHIRSKHDAIIPITTAENLER